MNGYTISYDIYQSNSSKAIDESYIQKLVADTHFTLIMDKAEAARQERLATITMAVISAVLIVLFILWRVLRKKSLRKKLEAKKQRTDALTQFFIRQRQKEEDNIRDTPLMTNHTTFSEAVIKTFYMYDRLIHHIKLWIISGALILIFLATLYSSGSLLVMLITILLVIVFVYIQGFQIDKAINRAMKVYEKNKNMNAVYTFYEDYFTLSGIQSNSVYPYIQITEVKAYKEYIYIYLGVDKAHYLQKSGFEPGLEQFLELMKRNGKLK
jgi:ABC-type multidrug transport system fused ATPase/permease subunit